MRHGQGVMTYANGDIYDGEWKEGRMDGKGTKKFRNGNEYEGGVKSGRAHGEGVLTYAAGDLVKSSGEWKDGKRCGKFENIVREQVYYDYENDKAKSVSTTERENKAQPDQNMDHVVFPMTLLLCVVFGKFLSCL